MKFDPEIIISLNLSLSALFISIVALIYTIKTFLLKKGLKIRGSFSLSSSITCKDKYLRNIVLENHKDRAVVIYEVYLKISNNYYLLVEDFGGSPFILQPFESFTKEYDPIELYSINLNRIDLNKLLSDRKIQKRIYLATSEGKYIVQDQLNTWNPIVDFFRNYFTAIIHIKRLNYKGVSYGSNTIYIIVFKTNDNYEEIIPIYAGDYQIKKFKNFKLTKDSLKSKEKLEEYLYNEILSLNTAITDIIVYDYSEWQNDFKDDNYNNVVVANKISRFKYNIIGPVYTYISKSTTKKNNKKRKRK